VQAVDGGLIADVRALHTQVQQHNAGDHRRERMTAERQEAPAREQAREKAALSDCAVPAVGDPSRDGGG
jgi:hypothetical protein